MKPTIIKVDSLNMTLTPERCYVAENYSSKDGKVSIAIATVKPGVTTVAHHLEGIEEIYIITQGTGIIDIKGMEPTKVVPGDVIVIPNGTSQRIENIDNKDLVFYCVCTPKFTQEQYFTDETSNIRI
ncbi:MAG: cupin domain-containing protein [Candidatus Bathyarchaeota archaeon]|nr:cupin domain-containing protein [Candidatus Termiticorpusculum sp.]MCL2292841.1 cupin domain-containing protein [Candidatus Termiticorpusculum sp.]